MILQNSLANFSFLTLLGSMILYWIETSFTQEVPSSSGNLISYGVGKEDKKEDKKHYNPNSFFYSFTDNKNKSLATYGIILSNISLSLLLIVRWKESGHFPLSNLYESLMFLSWCFTSLHLYVDYYTNGSLYAVKPHQEFYRKIIGAITTPSALLTNAFATFTLPKEMQEAAPLVPALQSNWLMMHVTVMILSYAALILGSLLSIAFLIVTADFPRLFFPKEKKGEVAPFGSTSSSTNPLFPERPKEETTLNASSALTVKPFSGTSLTASAASVAGSLQASWGENPPLETENKGGEERSVEQGRESGATLEGLASKRIKAINQPINQPIALVLDNLSYRILGIGFPLLTIGILSGAVWANEAWGSYWSWDPKETWALLTWLIFAIYLHTRLSKGWKGRKPAIIASFGFVIVWICYLGVNLIGEGLHSYGWIIKS